MMPGLMVYKDKYPEIGRDVYIAPGAWLIGDVVMGDRASVWFNTVVRADENYIHIGEDTNIQDNCVLHITGERFPVDVGNRVTIGHRAIVHGCTVEDDCLIGMGAIVMDGARIGKGSVVAAGCLVPPGFVVPPKSLAIGVPAVVKKEVGEEERLLVSMSVQHYVELNSDYRTAVDPERKPRVKGFLG